LIAFEILLGIAENLSLIRDSIIGSFSNREEENCFERKTKLRKRGEDRSQILFLPRLGKLPSSFLFLKPSLRTTQAFIGLTLFLFFFETLNLEYQ